MRLWISLQLEVCKFSLSVNIEEIEINRVHIDVSVHRLKVIGTPINSLIVVSVVKIGAVVLLLALFFRTGSLLVVGRMEISLFPTVRVSAFTLFCASLVVFRDESRRFPIWAKFS